ncbi:MAG: hypothetical protein U0L20_05060 [Ruminococcus sp.]|nr:hypothetical protein [Ruminococcus sp.]
MLKVPENKTLKRLRITQCILFLALILLCTSTFISGYDSKGDVYYRTVFDMLSYIGGQVPNSATGQAFSTYVLFYLVFPVIPTIGFFFCALDKEYNIKNFVSVICCLLGVVSILTIVTLNFIQIGSLLSLLIYLLLSFLSTYAMLARIAQPKSEKDKNESK